MDYSINTRICCGSIYIYNILVTKILGISAFYHDSAASIIENERFYTAQEERFTRKKHDSSYPFNAVEFVLKFTKNKLSEIDSIVFFEKPFLKFERLLETYVAFAPKGFGSFCKAMPIWLREKLFQKKMLIDQLKKHDPNLKNFEKIFFSDHHLSHALVLSHLHFRGYCFNCRWSWGVGNNNCSSREKNKLEIKKELLSSFFRFTIFCFHLLHGF